MSTLKTNTLDTPSGSGNITVNRPTVLTAGDIITADLANDAVTTVKIVDDAVTIAKLAATGTASSSTFLRGDNSWQEAGGGAWAVKTSGSVSSAASADFTGLSKWTQIYLTNVRTSDSDVIFRTSSNNGSSFDSGASDYNYYRHQNGFEGNTSNANRIDTVGQGYTNTTEDDCSIILSISRPAGTSQTHLEWKMLHNNDTSIYYRFGFGIRKSAADVDAIQILSASGTITCSYIVIELN